MNSRDPKNLKSNQTNDDPVLDNDKITGLAPSEELMLRVGQIFEEAEELWRWMYDE